MRVKVGELSVELNSIAREQQNLFKTAKGFEQTLATLEMKRQEAASKRSHLKELSEHMKFLGDSDEELHKLQHEYQDRLTTYVQHIASLKDEYNKTKSKLEQTRSNLGAKLTEEGRIEAEKKAYEGQLKERVDLVREISIKHGLKGFDGEVDDTLVQEFMAKIARMSRDQNLVLERIKRDNEDIIGTAQNDLNSLLNKKSSLQQKKEYAQSEIKNVDMKVRGLKRDLDGLNADAAKEVMAKDELNKKEKRLEEVKAQAQTADNDGSLHIQNTKLRDLEEDIERVTEELYRGTRNADSRAQLAILKQNIETRQKAFASLYVGNLI